MAAAQVREAAGIPGTSVHTTWLCRDKPAMKEALRAGRRPAARSRPATDARRGARRSPPQVGYPLILKPRDGAGASGTVRVDNDAELEQRAAPTSARPRRPRSPSRSSSRATRASTTRSRIDGHVVHDFVSHYYPNVLEAMRTRWISPQFVTTNRVDAAAGYGERARDGPAGHRRARHRHLGDPHGVVLRPEGPEVLRDRLPPAGRRRVGPLLRRQRHRHLPRVGAWRSSHGRAEPAAVAPLRRRASSRCAPTATAASPGYERRSTRSSRRYGEWIIDAHFPPPGTPTQPVEAGYMANAWVRHEAPRLRHAPRDARRRRRRPSTSTPADLVAHHRPARTAALHDHGRLHAAHPRCPRGRWRTVTAGWEEREEEDEELDTVLGHRSRQPAPLPPHVRRPRQGRALRLRRAVLP